MSEAEFNRTKKAILQLRGTTELLESQQVLKAAIDLRNPYVDPLSLLQIALLAEKRSPSPPALGEHLDEVLATTLNGVAQGLRNTG